MMRTNRNTTAQLLDDIFKLSMNFLKNLIIIAVFILAILTIFAFVKITIGAVWSGDGVPATVRDMCDTAGMIPPWLSFLCAE